MSDGPMRTTRPVRHLRVVPDLEPAADTASLRAEWFDLAQLIRDDLASLRADLINNKETTAAADSTIQERRRPQTGEQ